MLGWIVRRAANLDLTTLLSERIWQHIGAEHDYTFMVDSAGAETTSAATLRDFARFGQLFCDGGRVGSQQVIPQAVVDRILAGGDVATFARGDHVVPPIGSYRSQWWFRHIDGRVCAMARGAYGQLLYIDPANELVIARYGSAPEAPSSLLDPVILPTVDAITAEFSGNP